MSILLQEAVFSTSEVTSLSINLINDPNAVHLVALGNDSFNNSVSWTAPAGWVEIVREGDGAVDVHGIILAKPANTDAGPATFGWDTAEYACAAYFTIPGAPDLVDYVRTIGKNKNSGSTSNTNYASSDVAGVDGDDILCLYLGDGTDMLPNMTTELTLVAGQEVLDARIRAPDNTAGQGISFVATYGTVADFTGAFWRARGISSVTDGQLMLACAFKPGSSGPAFFRDGVPGTDIASVDSVDAGNIANVDGVT